MIARVLPYAAPLVVALANYLAFHVLHGVGSYAVLAAAWVPLALLAAMALREEEALGETLVFVPGDATKAIGATAVALGLLFAVALGAVRFAKARAGYDLYGVILVAGALPQVARGAAVVVISACEELVFRAAIARSLESKLGSSRAIWAASGLYVLAQVGSLHPSLIVAALLLSLTTTYLVARERRVLPAMMAHAAFSWLALEMITPAIWQRLGG